MANNVKGIYRFTNLKSGEVFEGTRDEYAKHLRMKESTINSHIKRGIINREKIGEIKIKQKKRIQRYTNFKTKQVFEGTRKEACEFFGIKDWNLAYMLRQKTIVSENIVSDKICEEKNKMPAPKSKEEKLRRELYRRECFLKALYAS